MVTIEKEIFLLNAQSVEKRCRRVSSFEKMYSYYKYIKVFALHFIYPATINIIYTLYKLKF